MRGLAIAVLAGALAGCGGDRGEGRGDVDYYSEPPLAVAQVLVPEGEGGAPREIRFFAPTAAGQYPLLQFQHGFTADVDTYTELLARLAGFGFVVAAPQMYVGDPSSAPGVADETAAAVQVLAWVQANADRVLAAQAVTVAAPDTGLLGHSRGGQVAWRMLFDHPGTAARAIAGVDPVDGDAPPFPPGQTGEMVTDDPGAFAFPFASLVIGMGLGGTGVPGFECAPATRNYTFFYDASLPPRYETVAANHGHSDMTNGDTPDLLCPGATDGSRGALRAFVAGQLAAYFSMGLRGAPTEGWLKDLANAPVAATGRHED